MASPGSLERRALEIAARLEKEYPGSATQLCALRHANAYELLVATILSAQCTDERVNAVLPELLARYPEPADLAGAPPEALEAIIRPTGFYRAKAASLTGMARGLVERFGGEVPTDLADLVTLPGVGRKTGNVVRSVAFGLPGLPVDTHVRRLARRLGLTTSEDPERIESDLCGLLPEAQWGAFSLRLILHGRRVCSARRPRCDACVLADLCPSAGRVDPRPPPAARRVSVSG
ncbi:MAG TPA: endonuclease III [Acidimicrobiales bacterium]|nr:endonuclease III [Acidimicrobiales bacterium]